MPFPNERSFTHPENGMAWEDMEAIREVANRRNEVITFRSTGPWAKRWISEGFPTKGFHVKGKSSDWGPMAGLVPWEGRYSKVGHDVGKAAKGNAANAKGVHEGYAKHIALELTLDQIMMQCTVPEERPSRVAVFALWPIPDSPDKLLFARRSGDQAVFPFRAVAMGATKPNTYFIHGFPDGTTTDEITLSTMMGTPLLVMASTEEGTDKPMTGDYDLFAICPSWGSYGTALGTNISIAGMTFVGKTPNALVFPAGSGMDRVMDPRLHTAGGSFGGSPTSGDVDYLNRRKRYLADLAGRTPGSHGHATLSAQLQQLGILDSRGNEVAEAPWLEHEDMGNLTPRILQCIMEMNEAMGVGTMGLTRRVHHNAESHRFRQFAALNEEELKKGDGLPITVFQPARMSGKPALEATGYDRIDTLETWDEFRAYAQKLSAVGYYVPRNWIWGT
jgi:hypothetical protein